MKRIFKAMLKASNFNPTAVLYDFFKALLIYLIATSFALCLVGAEVIHDNIFGMYILGVAVTSVITSGYFWGIAASVGGVIGVNFFFTYPYYSLNFTITGYPITFAVLLLISILISTLTAKVKKAAVISSSGKKWAETLNEMSKAILTASDRDVILEMATDYFYEANQCSVVLYLGSPLEPEKKAMRLMKDTDEQIFNSILERQGAFSAFDTGRRTGANLSDQTQNCKGTYFPIMTKEQKYGVIGLLFEDSKLILNNTYGSIDVMISQTILGLERQEMIEKAQDILLEKEKEKMRSNLLRAVSHDLRTPLTGILGSTATLIENSDTLSKDANTKLLRDIYQDTEWLIHMVENLLSVTKISGNETNLKKQEEIVEEVVSEAVTRTQKRFPDAHIDVKVPDELLIVPMDATLIEQVLINLMENAIRHSGSSLPIGLRVAKKKSGAVFTIYDHGKGIDPSQIPDLFDGNSRSSDSSRGIGIGLSICKSIILAHSGTIFAKNNQSGGASFTFVLPMKGENTYGDESKSNDY